jgi:peptide/nickel transport system permease protein
MATEHAVSAGHYLASEAGLAILNAGGNAVDAGVAAGLTIGVVQSDFVNIAAPLTRYFAITLILSLIGWTELARVVRGRFLSLRSEDFVTAARLDGCRERRVIFRHMLPSMISHIIASVTLAIPLMILAETSLSFLGLGLQPPTISWGVLLKEAQNVRSIAQAPWLFIPGGAVVIAVLALNFLGDGLRDAADPYAQESP